MKNISLFVFLLILMKFQCCLGQGQISISLDGLADWPNFNMPSGANYGLGVVGSLEFRGQGPFSIGLNSGMVEFLAPTGQQDLKTLWLDVMGRAYPLPVGFFGEPYLQLGVGVSPYLGGIFEDYWPQYAARYLGWKTDPGTVYFTGQVALGTVLPLDKDLGLDTGLQYDLFGPPWQGSLDTLGFRAGMVWSFSLGPS